ncbi:SMI1/KNR4 family protein [Pectobacterium cacticida]|uniref:SMI1/KNR4 family protein n=1 Tax=Pectobacterium cacticida TaxID=69221 RepID=UPI002FF4313D
MRYIIELIDKLTKDAEDEVFWLGAADENQIALLEEKLMVNLPDDFKGFLSVVGGGGIVGEEISGIVDNNALAESGGAVYYDTCYCRNEYELPNELVVIYFKDDDVCWCINTSATDFGSVVNYNLFSRKVDRKMHPTFTCFFDNYVKARIK